VKFGEGASRREVNLEITALGTERDNFLIAFEDGAGPAGHAPAAAARTPARI